MVQNFPVMVNNNKKNQNEEVFCHSLVLLSAYLKIAPIDFNYTWDSPIFSSASKTTAW